MTDEEVKEFMKMVDCLNLTTIQGIELIDYIKEFDETKGDKNG